MLPSICLTVCVGDKFERVRRVVVDDEFACRAASALTTSGIGVPRASFDGQACQEMSRLSKPGREREMAKKRLVGAVG